MISAVRGSWSNLHPVTRRRLRIGGLAAGLLVAIWLLLSFVAVYALTRRARSRHAESLPAGSVYQIEEHRVRTADGEEIGMWFVAGAPQRPTVVLVHGNGGHRDGMWRQALLLLKEKYPVLLITCRAHGDSTGNYNDFGWGARHDVIAAVNWLRQRKPDGRVVLWGASLGSAAVVFAARYLQPNIDAVVLECPYKDLHTAVRNRLENQLPPIVDSVCYVGMRVAALVYVPHFSEISPLRFIETIPQTAPILIVAGEEDRRARPVEAIALHERVKSHSKLKIFPHAAHLGLGKAVGAEYDQVVLDFLRPLNVSSTSFVKSSEKRE